MICYLIRHGRDDETVRGGWSASPLTDEGIQQAEQLAEKIRTTCAANIGMIYTSDLPRATHTAAILSASLSIPVEERPEFREVNNGILAGMDNQLASEQFPGLYWNTLGWDEPYPGGESPLLFHERISSAWHSFKKQLRDANHDVILVTHGGVIQIILCLEHGLAYSNQRAHFSIKPAEMVAIPI